MAETSSRWHRVDDRDVPDERRGPQCGSRRAQCCSGPLRAASGCPGEPLPASGWPARRGIDQEGSVAVPVARLSVFIVGAARDQVQRLAERLGAPVLTTFKAKGLIPDAHPARCRRTDRHGPGRAQRRSDGQGPDRGRRATLGDQASREGASGRRRPRGRPCRRRQSSTLSPGICPPMPWSPSTSETTPTRSAAVWSWRDNRC